MSATEIFIELDPEPETPKSTTAAFFQCGTHELQRIALLDGSAKDAASYLVLCGGVNERRSLRASTHGALSISNRTGISYRDAEHSIAWLVKHNFIYAQHLGDEEGQPDLRSRKGRAQWIIADDKPNVAISQQFLGGVRNGAKRPLVAFFERVRGTDDITTVEAGIDALVLFAVLMRDLDFGAWAGVNPCAWSNRFVLVENDEDTDGNPLSPAELPLDGSDHVLVSVREGQSSNTYGHVVNDALGYIQDDNIRFSRFWHALDQLRHAQLVYRVLVLWKGDPLGTNRPRHAEPQATLYINDSWARQIDHQIQADVNRAAWRHYSEYTQYEFDKEGVMNQALAGRHRFIVKNGTQNRYSVLAQLRPRFWPANAPTVAGRTAERARTIAWAEKMRSLKPS